MSPTELNEDTSVRRPLLLRVMFDVLTEALESMPVTAILERVGDRVELTPSELSKNASGSPRWDTFLRFASGWGSRIGWISKRGGWSITEAGLASTKGLGPDELYREIKTRYRVVYKEDRKRTPRDPDPRWSVVRDALALIGGGSWTTYGDLAEVADLSAQSIGQFVANQGDLPNGYRVLQADGSISSGFRWSDSRTDDPRDVLRQEGIEFDEHGRALQSQRITAEDLRELLADLDSTATTQRAWLVRGSSVNGRDLVPVWLRKGSISLAGSHLKEVQPGISRDELKPMVEQDYAHLSYAARAEKLDEFHAFLTKMQAGDLVATTSQGRLYLGEILASRRTSAAAMTAPICAAPSPGPDRQRASITRNCRRRSPLGSRHSATSSTSPCRSTYCVHTLIKCLKKQPLSRRHRPRLCCRLRPTNSPRSCTCTAPGFRRS